MYMVENELSSFRARIKYNKVQNCRSLPICMLLVSLNVLRPVGLTILHCLFDCLRNRRVVTDLQCIVNWLVIADGR
jgi:hypothetical protein